MSFRRVVPTNYDPKGERFLIASRFPTPPLACAFFSPGATMTYRLNPRYVIKECLSCGALYTRDFCYSKGNVEDKILVPKLPKNYARCGHRVNGLYCQGCTLLQEKLEEDLVTYFQNFQNTFESSDDSTNVVNAPREPFVVKKDHGVNPPHIDECCYECGDALDGIYCQQCICKSCGKGAHTGYNCPQKVPIISNPEPCNQTMNNELPHTLPSFDPTSRTTLMEQMTQLSSMYEMFCQIVQKKQEEKRIEEEQVANARYWKIPACCDDDDDYNFAITPVLSTEEPVDSLIMRDEHLDTIQATKSDEVKKFSVEDLVSILSEFEVIPDNMCDVHLINNPTPLEAKDHFEIVINSNDDISSGDDDSLYNENIEYVEASPHNSEVVSLEVAEIVIPKEEEIEDDNLREKLMNVHLLIANIEALKDNPTPSTKILTKSSSTSPKSFLEETNTFHNSFPEFENFYFDLGEISSGSTTTHSDISLLDYEAFSFNNDHIEKISSGSTTTHSDISLSEYDSFVFDSLNDQFPPTDRSDLTHEEFADELAHIISPPEYDCFYFWNLPDPGITINRVYSFKPGLSHWCGAFKKFNTHRSHLNEWPMIINGKNTLILDVLLFHFYPLDQLNLLHLAGSQPMLKSSNKAEDGVIISIPPLVGGVADVVGRDKRNR
nr:hypothetical protein [Tanacetum cinerariifolium]